MIRQLTLLSLMLGGTSAALAAPEYHQTVLQSIYPAGGQRGQEVAVELIGMEGGTAGASDLLIDGPAGVTVKSVEAAGSGRMQAVLKIAADAPPGRRMIRARGGRTGLTNFRWFFVGGLPEHLEQEKNSSVEQAEKVTTPVVINGRIGRTLDQDCFRFEARQGQSLVAVVRSHGLDAMGYSRDTMGFFDASLELLDAQGRVLAESGDALGFDPLIQHVIPADGEYVVRVSGLAYKGFPQAVYRLTLGEVPYPIATFPPGGRFGETVDVEVLGPNVPPGTTRKVQLPADGQPGQYVTLEGLSSGDVPLHSSRWPAVSYATEHPGRESAPRLSMPVTVNGRFQGSGGEHWYRLNLAQGEQVTLEIVAQRYLHAPIDTLVEVFGPEGKLVASNDDGEIFASECVHDFVPFDSRLEIKAQAAGEHLVRVAEQTGARGPQAVYRLNVYATQPDFRLFQFPDAVPVWGPGSTAAFCVEVTRLGDLRADIELSVEGLPQGWVGSRAVSYSHEYRTPRGAFGAKTFLTITAPESANVGDLAEFRVVGRSQVDGRVIEHVAQPLTLYMWQEPNHFRSSPIARAAVAPPVFPALHTSIESMEVTPGAEVELPVRFDFGKQTNPGSMSLTINRAGTHFKCGLRSPLPIQTAAGNATVPLTIPERWKPGVYTVVVAHAWASETRKGMPGPCTPLIELRVPAAAGK